MPPINPCWVQPSFILKDKTLYSSCDVASVCLCRCYKKRITKKIHHRLDDLVRHYLASDLSRHCYHYGNWNTDMFYDDSRQQSFKLHPLEAAQLEFGVDTTKTYSIQRFIGIKHPMKIFDEAFCNSLPARSMRRGIKQSIILMPKGWLH